MTNNNSQTGSNMAKEILVAVVAGLIGGAIGITASIFWDNLKAEEINQLAEAIKNQPEVIAKIADEIYSDNKIQELNQKIADIIEVVDPYNKTVHTEKIVASVSLSLQAPGNGQGELFFRGNEPELRITSKNGTCMTRILVKDNHPELRMAYDSEGKNLHKNADITLHVEDRTDEGTIIIDGKKVMTED